MQGFVRRGATKASSKRWKMGFPWWSQRVFRFGCSYSHGPGRQGVQESGENAYRQARRKLRFEGRSVQKCRKNVGANFLLQVWGGAHCYDAHLCEKVRLEWPLMFKATSLERSKRTFPRQSQAVFRFWCSYSHGPSRIGCQEPGENAYRQACPKLWFEGRLAHKPNKNEGSRFSAAGRRRFGYRGNVMISRLPAGFLWKLAGSRGVLNFWFRYFYVRKWKVSLIV